MDVKAWVPKLCNLLGKQLDSLGILAKDDCLVNIKFWEKSVQAVEFLSFLKVCVVLSYSFQSELVHQVYELWVRDVFLLKPSDCNGVGCWEQRDLFLFWHKLNNLCHNNFKIIRQKFINFIQYKHTAVFEFCNIFWSQIKNSAWSSHNNMNSLIKTINVLFDRVTTSWNHAFNFFVLSKFFNNKWCLHCKFSCWYKNQTLNAIQLHIHLLDKWNWICSSLTCTIFSSCNNVLFIHCNWNTFLLNWRWIFIAFLVNAKKKLFWKVEVGKFEAFCCSNIISFDSYIFFWCFDAIYI